VYPHLGDFL